MANSKTDAKSGALRSGYDCLDARRLAKPGGFLSVIAESHVRLFCFSRSLFPRRCASQISGFPPRFYSGSVPTLVSGFFQINGDWQMVNAQPRLNKTPIIIDIGPRVILLPQLGA